MTARLDVELAARGLARSRTAAHALIADGAVLVDGRVATRPSLRVDDTQRLVVTAPSAHVSRAAGKLVAALDVFNVSVVGRLALDMGASTGGFTQVLRERGARRVIAVDVGHGQLDPLVAADPGVVAVEGFNVRHMTPATLSEASGVVEAPDLLTGDLSFISLTHVLPAATEVAGAGADLVLLIKPQFEVGRGAVRGGIVTDPSRRADAVRGVLRVAADLGWQAAGLIASPVVGTHGNREALVHLRRSAAPDPTQWEDTVIQVAGDA